MATVVHAGAGAGAGGSSSSSGKALVAATPVMAAGSTGAKGGAIRVSCVEADTISGVASIASSDDKTTKTLDIVGNGATGSAVRIGVLEGQGKPLQPKVLVSAASVDVKVPMTVTSLVASDAVSAKSFSGASAALTDALTCKTATADTVTAKTATADTITTKTLGADTITCSSAITATGGLIIPAGVGMYFGQPGATGSWFMGPSNGLFTVAEFVAGAYTPVMSVRPPSTV